VWILRDTLAFVEVEMLKLPCSIELIDIPGTMEVRDGVFSMWFRV
jgi:hypothetical protein